MNKILLVILVAWQCFATIHYVREGGTGSGTDWTTGNASDEIPAVIPRGDTVMIADGSYSAYTFNDAEVGTDSIWIRKATTASHGTETGWDNAYGDGQAVWDTTEPSWVFTTGYYAFDGVVGGRDTLAKGFEVSNTHNAVPVEGGCCLAVFANSPIVSHLTFKKVKIIGAGSALDIAAPAICRAVYFSDTTSDITFDSCTFLRAGQQFIHAGNMLENWTLSNCVFKNCGSGSAEAHSVMLNMYGVATGEHNLTIKNNIFQDFVGGPGTGGSGVVQLGSYLDIDIGGVYIYGNTFSSTRAGTDSASFLVGNSGDGDNYNTYFVNNTIVNLKNNMDRVDLNGTTGNNYAINNLYVNCDNAGFVACNDVTNHEVTSLDFRDGYYRLSEPLIGATAVSDPYNIDPDGNTRSNDYGAYEFSDCYSLPRGRVGIENNTVVTDNGQMLRGGTFWLYGWMANKVNYAKTSAPWDSLQKYGFNTVRLACAYRPETEDCLTLDQYELLLDSLVDTAASRGMYAIIDWHPTPGDYNETPGSGEAFWERFAPRYKDRTHVIYEVCNEPVFSQPVDYTKAIRDSLLDLYRMCRVLAPQTHIMMFTFPNVGYSGIWPSHVADSVAGIEYTNASVCFHSYWRDTTGRMEELKTRYPTINGEFRTVPDGTELKVLHDDTWIDSSHARVMERLGISWIAWDIVDESTKLGNFTKTVDWLSDSALTLDNTNRCAVTQRYRRMLCR